MTYQQLPDPAVTDKERATVRSEAEQLFARLDPMERRQPASVLRVVLDAPDLGAAFLALMDQETASTAVPLR
ncbi:hypothetical protein ACFU9X_45635 [Streptomyces atratus]|uniref:hypothetical protein n=1 Tax=Streptomyces atratus TaxID=1893 RepID=UPI00369E793E